MKKLLYLSTIALALFSCQKNEPDSLFDGKTPEQRFEENQAELRSELTAPADGWKLTYFTNEKKFGGYNFVMRFTPEGFVTMTTDFGSTATPTTSKYEIKWGQGTLLSFTTKNYIHELADTTQGEQGKGYQGEFEFIYFGKEGNKLKFKTQRKDTEQFVYFEPATAQDWNVQDFKNNISTLQRYANNYYFTVSTASQTIGYDTSLSNGVLKVKELPNGQEQSVAVAATSSGLTFKPALTLQGKTFTELTADNTTSPTTYKATVEGVTAQIAYSLLPPDEFVTDDYQDVPSKINVFAIVPSNMKDRLSRDFYDNILKIDGSKEFYIFRIDFNDNGTCTIQISYRFDGNTNSWVYITCKYELKNKRLYLKDGGNVLATNLSTWQKTENTAIFEQAKKAVTKIVEIGTEGFYVTNTGGTLSDFQIYNLQSHNNPNYNASFLSFKRQ